MILLKSMVEPKCATINSTVMFVNRNVAELSPEGIHVRAGVNR